MLTGEVGRGSLFASSWGYGPAPFQLGTIPQGEVAWQRAKKVGRHRDCGMCGNVYVCLWMMRSVALLERSQSISPTGKGPVHIPNWKGAYNGKGEAAIGL